MAGAILLWTAGAGVAAATYPCPAPVLAGAREVADDGACLQEVAPGVYVIFHADPVEDYVNGNTGVIEGRNSLFVIDSTYLPSRARADIALIRQVTSKPVRYLTTTHWHMDHNQGASAYVDAFPDLTYIAERNTARLLELNQTYWRARVTSEDGPKRRALAAAERELSLGLDEHGVNLTDTERRRRERVIAERRNEQNELRALAIISPTRLFDGTVRLSFEGRRIEIRHWGRANSPHDSTVYLSDAEILFAGDILVQAPLPYVSGAYPTEWVQVLAELERYPARIVVPGHGGAIEGHRYTSQMRAYLESAISQATSMFREGQSVEQMIAAVDLENVRSGEASWAAASDQDWRDTNALLLGRIVRDIRGYEF